MKVGDYVRTKYGIAKIVGSEAKDLIINLDKAIMYDHIDYIASCTHEEIINSSPDIIDLIEVGDYVNGYRVAEIETLPTKQKLVVVGYGYDADEISENNIKSIVTKEQFESVEYKI